MDFSLLRALRASVRLTLTTLKRDSKRLQRTSEDVFGTRYTLSICQEAYARARGFRNWHEAETILKRGGRNPDTHFWKIVSRNDLHEAVFSSIVTADLEMSENGPVCFFGPQEDAALPALCLWIEALSMAEVPGVLLVDTTAPALQDTTVWKSVVALNLESLFDEFRYIDARSDNIPLAFSTTSKDWCRSLLLALPESTCAALQSCGFAHLLETAIDAVGRDATDDNCQVFGDTVRQVSLALCSADPGLPPSLHATIEESSHPSLHYDFKSYVAHQRPAEVAQLTELCRALFNKQFGLGRHLSQETLKRPSIVLFDSNDPASVVLASVVHSQYYWRFVGPELRYRGINTRPVLFVSDTAVPQVPHFIRNSGASHTCVVNGAAREGADHWPESESARASFVFVEGDSFIYSGRRARFGANTLTQGS